MWRTNERATEALNPFAATLLSPLAVPTFVTLLADFMPRFTARIEGRNFLFKWGETGEKFGFYTTRTVKASDEREAELKVMDLLRDELREQVINEHEDPPMMYLDGIWRTPFLGRKKKSGLVFFPESSTDDESINKK